MHLLFYVLGGLAVGMVSGMLGIGGGIILVPLCLYAFKLSMHQAVGTSLGVIVPTALCAALVHYSHGNVIVPVVLKLFVFALVGGFLGAHIAG